MGAFPHHLDGDLYVGRFHDSIFIISSLWQPGRTAAGARSVDASYWYTGTAGMGLFPAHISQSNTYTVPPDFLLNSFFSFWESWLQQIPTRSLLVLNILNIVMKMPLWPPQPISLKYQMCKLHPQLLFTYLPHFSLDDNASSMITIAPVVMTSQPFSDVIHG